MAKFNVLFATDENYIKNTSVTIISLLENNKDIFIKIYYILDKISNNNKKKLESLIKRYNCSLEFVIINGDDFKSFSTGHHFNKSVYYRFGVAKFIFEDSILYMDSDIVVNGSIKEIFEINFEDNFLLAVENPGFFRHTSLGMDDKSKYFNAGFVFINLLKWKEFNIYNKCIEYSKKNFKNIELADQDVLNAVIDGKWLELDPKFNQQAIIFDNNFSENYNNLLKWDLDNISKNPIIIHYSGSLKPWHFRSKHPFKKLYWKYLGMSNFNRFIYEDFNPLFVIKKLLLKLSNKKK